MQACHIAIAVAEKELQRALVGYINYVQGLNACKAFSCVLHEWMKVLCRPLLNSWCVCVSRGN